MKIIERDSALYLKRLVRELNSIGCVDGFYASYGTFQVRCTRARMRANVLECRSPAVDGHWFIPSNHIFPDVYGRDVIASRKG